MGMRLVELAPPQRTPVPVRELAAHLRMGSGFAGDRDEDAALEMYLRAATAAIEARLGLALIARPMELRVAAWASESAQPVPVAPLVAVDSVALIDAGGARDELASGALVFSMGQRPPVLSVAGGLALPSIPADGFAEVRFTAGFGETANDVPPDLRQAVLLLAATYYERRDAGESPSAAMPFAVLALLEPHRALRV